jgi:hypothetical protein
MKRLAILLRTALVLVVSHRAPASAQIADTITGTWTAFPLVYSNVGVGGEFSIDLTEEPRHVIELTLSEDGKLVEVPASVLTQTRVPTGMETLLLANVGNGYYRTNIDYDPCPADSIDCYPSPYLVEIHVLSDERIELYQQRIVFEGGEQSKMLLMRGEVTDEDPLAAEFSAPRCPGAPVSRMVAGKTLMVAYDKGLNVRQKPSRSAAAVGSLDWFDQALALDGPVCADGFQYWHVQYDNGKTGWAAEGNGKDYWMTQDEYVPPFNYNLSNSEYGGVVITLINNQIVDEQIQVPAMRGQ